MATCRAPNCSMCTMPSEGINVYELYPSLATQTLHGFYKPLAFLPVTLALCRQCAKDVSVEQVVEREALTRISLNIQDKTTLFPDFTQSVRTFVEYDTEQYADTIAFIDNATRSGAKL